MEPMEIEQLLVLKNLAQDVRHFLLRQKNEADKCLEDFDETHNKLKLTNKLTTIFCELNAFSISHAEALKTRITDFGEEDEFNASIKRLEELVSNGNNETSPVKPDPTSSDESLVLKLSQSSSVHPAENLSQATCEYSIESEGLIQPIVDSPSILERIDALDTTITTINSEPVEILNLDANISAQFSEEDFDITGLISYNKVPQGSSVDGDKGKQINTSSADENNTNVEEINSSTTTAEVSSVSAVEQVSSDTIDQDKAKQSDINEDVATQVSSSTDKSIYGVNESIIDVSIDQGNAKLPSGADESDNEVEMDAIVQDSNVSNDVGKAKLPSGADKSDSDADYDAETQVSSVSDTKSPANVDQLNAKLPSVADENDLDEDSDVATQVTSVSDAQGNVKLPSGADESDSEADFDAATQVSSISDVKPPADVDDQLNAAQATSVSAKLPFGANESYSDADFDAATEISSVSDARGNTKLPSGADESDSDADLDADTSKQDKLPSTANDAVTENQSLLKEQLRQEAVDNDGDISASDSSNEAPQAIVKTKMDIFKEISEFVKKKKEEGQSNGSSDAKEKEDDLSTKKKRKRKKKFKSKARVSTTENSNSNENNLDITNKVVSDDIISKTHNGETRESQPITRLEDTDTDKTEISDTEPNQKVISPFKKKIIKPLPETSSDSDGILLKKKATALPVSSSNYEDSEPGRGTKRQFSTSDDSESMPPKKVSAAIDDDEDPVQDIQRHSNTPEDSITSDDVVASSKRKISESSTHSYQFNLDEQASDSLCELSNSNKKNKSTEEEPSAELQLNIEDRDNLLSMLDDKEQEEARNNQDQLLNLPNAERDELLDLLNQGERVSEVDESSDNNDAENGHLSDSLLSDEDAPKASPPNKFSLDNQGRDELLDLLTEKYQDCQIEDDKQGTKTKGVNRDMLLEILNEFMQINSNSQDVKTEIMNVDGMELDCNREPDLDAGSDSNSVFLDVVREEIAEQDYKKPTENPEETDEDQAAWDAFHDLNKDDDEFISSSSSSTSIDTDIDDDLDIDFSDQERREEEKKNIDKIKQDFNINKELYVKVEKTDFSDYTNKVKKRTTGKTDEDDRLCDISNVLKKNTKSKLVRNKPTLQDHSGSRSSSSNRSDSSRLNNSLSVGYDSDNDTYISDNDVPLSNEDQSDDDQSNDERYHTLLIDNIFNSSDDEQSKNDSDDEVSSDEEKIRKKVLTRKNKKKKDIDTSGSEKEDATEVKESAELDSSDEEDFVGTRKERKTWRNDPLLISSDTDDEHSKKKLKKRNKIQENGWNDTSTSDSSSVHETPDKTVISSEDSDGDCKVLDKTPLKPIIITDDDESSSKKNKGRRNLKPLVEDDALAISTQVANNEERARIKRLQERDKEKEIYANNTCNIEEEDPLILDSYKGTEIRVHPKITVKLKPHQREGIQFMWDSCYESIKQMEKGWEGSGCILAHCMGLGKTLQALALIQTLFTCDITKIKHVLVVCPLSTVSNWRNEHKLAYQNIRNSHVRFYAIQNDGNDRFRIVQNWYKTGGMLVLGYECFALMIDQKKWEKWAKTRLGFLKADTFKALVDPGPDLIICDEGHLLRNKQTQRTMALNKVKTRRRIVLTGTPLQNNLLEYYYMVHFVKPNLLGTEKEFKTNFVNPICNGQFEDSTADDIMIMKKRTHVLHKILNKTVQRVEDSELKQYLPNFTDQAVFVKLSDLQVHLYNAFLDMVNSRPVVYTKAGEVSRASFLGDIQILRYICQHPDVVLIAEKTWKLKIKEHDVIDDLDFVEEVRAFERNGWYKDLLPKAGTKKLEMGTKMMTVVNLVKEAAEIGDKVLIFAQAYAEMDNLEWFLSHHLNFKKHIDYSRMDGTIKAEHRAAMCKSFNSKKNSLKVFIMSTKVGGLGLNLTAANRVILMNVNWNPSYDIQSVFRVFRFGQTKPVYVYRLIAMDTMEEKMYQRQVTKLAIAHRVVDKHQITRHYSAADIQEFYSVRPTIHGDRPIPNVPEDRVLAKLLQKHQFIHRWHEHQALLANRPEEDLDEMQKNAAWEEFNRKPEPPPPFPVPVDNPNFLTATSVLAGQPGPWAPQIIPLGRYAGPSGTQPRVSVMPHRLPGTPGFFTRPPGQVFRPPGQVFGPPNLRPGPSGVYPVAPRPAHLGLQPVQSVVQSRPLGQLPVSSGQQPGPSDLNNRPGFVPVPQKLNAVRQKSPQPPTEVFYVPNEDQNTTPMTSLDDVNILIRSQTTSQQIPTTSAKLLSFFTATPTTPVFDPKMQEQIDEFNSIMSEHLSKIDYNTKNYRQNSQEWAEDGMNETLSTIDLPSTDEEAEQN